MINEEQMKVDLERKIKRVDEIEKELRQMQKEWIDMYEEIMRLKTEKITTNYIEDKEHDND